MLFSNSKGLFGRLTGSRFVFFITEIVARMFQFVLLRALLPFTYDAPQIEPLLKLPRRRSSRIPQVLKIIGPAYAGTDLYYKIFLCIYASFLPL